MPELGMTSRDVYRCTPIDKDDGCEYAISCLSCPLSMCKYDVPGIVQKMQRQERNAAVLEVIRLHIRTNSAIAKMFHIDVRTVQRIKEQANEL